MHAMAHALLEWETIDKEQIDDIMEGRPPRAPRSTEAQENMKPRASQPAAKPTVKAEEPPAAADAAPTDKLVDTGSDEPDVGSKRTERRQQARITCALSSPSAKAAAPAALRLSGGLFQCEKKKE